MLEKDNPEMPLKTQADLLGISYSSLFYAAGAAFRARTGDQAAH